MVIADTWTYAVYQVLLPAGLFGNGKGTFPNIWKFNFSNIWVFLQVLSILLKYRQCYVSFVSFK